MERVCVRSRFGVLSVAASPINRVAIYRVALDKVAPKVAINQVATNRVGACSCSVVE